MNFSHLIKEMTGAKTTKSQLNSFCAIDEEEILFSQRQYRVILEYPGLIGRDTYFLLEVAAESYSDAREKVEFRIQSEALPAFIFDIRQLPKESKKRYEKIKLKAKWLLTRSLCPFLLIFDLLDYYFY